MAHLVLHHFEVYQKARVDFVKSIAEFALEPNSLEVMRHCDVMPLLRPLLLDNVPSIQISAALALGRLANCSDDMAEAIVEGDVIAQLVGSFEEQGRNFKKAAAFLFRSVVKHTPPLAQAVVDAGALDVLVPALEEMDASVKEAIAWTIDYISVHNGDLAQAVVDAGGVPLLVLCLQEPELSLKRISAAALSDISKHHPELAQAVLNQGALPVFASLVEHHDTKLKRQVCACLAQIAKHSLELAETVANAGVFPKLLACVSDADEIVQKHAVTCIREMVKHDVGLADQIVRADGVPTLVNFLSESVGNARLPGIMALGYISAFSEEYSSVVINHEGIATLKDALVYEQEDHIKAACAWSFGQIGQHSSGKAQALAEAEILPILLENYMDDSASDDLRKKSGGALKSIIDRLTHLDALLHLELNAPPSLQSNLLRQFAKILPSDAAARREFYQSGCLQKISTVTGGNDEERLEELIMSICSCYPPEAVNSFKPNYGQHLLESLVTIK